MPIIALANQKGGCSKSTTSVHFVHWLQKTGRDVALVDADAQRSSSLWLEEMESAIPFYVLAGSDELLEQVPDIAANHDYVVIDGPAGLAEPTRAILLLCDFALLPCQPTAVDLRSAVDAIRLVRQAQKIRNGSPKTYAFLARAVKGTRLKEEAVEALSEMGVPSLETPIHQRQVVADCFGQGATVWDMPGRPAAESAKEFEALFKEAMEVLQ